MDVYFFFFFFFPFFMVWLCFFCLDFWVCKYFIHLLIEYIPCKFVVVFFVLFCFLFVWLVIT